MGICFVIANDYWKEEMAQEKERKRERKQQQKTSELCYLVLSKLLH